MGRFGTSISALLVGAGLILLAGAFLLLPRGEPSIEPAVVIDGDKTPLSELCAKGRPLPFTVHIPADSVDEKRTCVSDKAEWASVHAGVNKTGSVEVVRRSALSTEPLAQAAFDRRVLDEKVAGGRRWQVNGTTAKLVGHERVDGVQAAVFSVRLSGGGNVGVLGKEHAVDVGPLFGTNRYFQTGGRLYSITCYWKANPRARRLVGRLCNSAVKSFKLQRPSKS